MSAPPQAAGAHLAGARAPEAQLLLAALRDPAILVGLPLVAWDRLIPLARLAGLLARLGVQLAELGELAGVPAAPRAHLEAAISVGEHHARSMRWEVGRIRAALADLDAPIVLLKGAAYVLAGLPPARGRLASDIDILLPRERLPQAEQALLAAGWQHLKLDPYDQRYYRTWMHELPPLFHPQRHSVIDVHHAILPDTARLRPDPAQLLRHARPLGPESNPRLQVLAPADMVLHSAVHLFQDGEFDAALRNLVDLDDLLRHFGADPGFATALLARAAELGLQRPLFYALRYTTALLGTPVRSAPPAPGWPVRVVMDALVMRALLPDSQERPSRRAAAARWCLYVRGHWLRMPPRLLVQHLGRKALRRARGPAEDARV